MYERTLSLIGDEAFAAIRASRIAVIGVGGVGGYAAEMLARCGVGTIVLADGDVVDETNRNRQIIALSSTVGRYKCEVMKERIADIDPDIEVRVFNKRLTADNAGEIVGGSDYIIDAIDSVRDKVSLIKYAKDNDIRIISAMGAGKRSGMPCFTVCDIYETSYDKLAKKMRGLLKAEGIESLDVCYSSAPCEDTEGVIGSIAYQPAVCGITAAAHAINRIMGKV